MKIRLGLAVGMLVALVASVAGVGVRAETPDVLIGGPVTHLGTIPQPGVAGARIKTVDTLLGPVPYLIANTPEGITAFDVSVPERPVPVGHLPVPHFYSEDIDFGGDVLLVGIDPDWADVVTAPGTVAGLYVVDISQLPAMTLHYINPFTANRWVDPVRRDGGHTVSCVVDDCSWAWVNGDDQIAVLDLTTPSDPQVAGFFPSGMPTTHDLQVDEAGLVWVVGSGGIVAYSIDGPGTPWAPVRVTNHHAANLAYHHNSLRPDAGSWQPRSAATLHDPVVRDGETILITEEAVWPAIEQTGCNGQGRFQTRWLRDTDAIGTGATTTLDVLDTWETELQAAGLAAPAVMCSAHYFDERDDLVAVAWYDQGTRILDVSDPRAITQIGYFIPPGGSPWSAVWAGAGSLGGEIVYSLDYNRGIDILRVDRDGPLVPVEAPILPQWTAGSGAALPARFQPHPEYGWLCAIPIAS